MQPPSLLILPTELISAILSSVSSADDLFAFLRASIRMYESFTGAKEKILSAVAHNSLDPRRLPDALIALRCLRERRNTKGSRNEKPTIQIRSLSYTIAEANNTIPPPPQLPLIDLISLFKYQRVVEDFVQDYASRHVVKYGGPSLSSLELYRLRRAFYKYDTFQSSNNLANKMARSDCNRLVCAALVLDSASSPWEVEEVVCVHEYILRRLEDVFDQVEQDYVESVVASTQEAAKLDGDANETSRPSQDVTMWSGDHPSLFFAYDDENDNEHREFFWTTGKQSHYHAMQYLSTLGLPFLRDLFHTSDKSTRRKTVVKNFLTHSYTLTEILLDCTKSFEEEEQAFDSYRKLALEGDAPEKRNLGWLWANQYRATPYFASPCDSDFRSWGYVFWDRARLDYLNVVKEPCPRVSRNWISPDQRDRGREKSVEQRLVEMGLIQAQADPYDIC
jgi:hypothetical protein